VTPASRALTRVLIGLVSLASISGIPASSLAENSRVLAGFPLFKQQHSLTCESSAASMATRGAVTESQLMAGMPRRWNPNLGFRGNPDGHQGTTLVDYGVYALPLQRALLRYGFQSDVLTYSNDYQIEQYLTRGWPIVVWITYALQPAQPRMEERNGVPFFLVPHEHAVLVVGYDDNTILVHDPWTGTQARYRWRAYNRSWGYFANMALAIQPCITPGPVTGLQISSLSPTGITWSWIGSRRAAAYQVDITRHGTQNKSVYSAIQTDTSATITSPLKNYVYEIAVRAISVCGGESAIVRLSAEISDTGATPTPTPTPGERKITATATATRTAVTLSSPTVTPSPTSTPKP
jgi:uncharacterized protein YvpB